MKKFALIIYLLLASNICFGQEMAVNLDAVALKRVSVINKNDTITISNIFMAADGYVGCTTSKNLRLLYTPSKFKSDLHFLTNDIDEFWRAHIATNVFPYLSKGRDQAELRHEMELDALQFIQVIRDNGLMLDDPMLKNYIYELTNKILPTSLLQNSPYNVNIVIQQSPEVNAYCYPNGTIVVNTGLLANLHSEDELVAVLSHEIAHFVLDHSVKNVTAAIARQKRAEFWAAFATGLAAVADGVLTVRNEYHIPGAITAGVAVASAAIASSVVERLGMKYNHDQELEADNLAQEILIKLGYNKYALATVLKRIANKRESEGYSYALSLDSKTHPSLVRRINEQGTPDSLIEKNYEQMVSFAVTNAAKFEFENRRFKQCMAMVEQNIVNGMGTVDDYMLYARCLLAFENTPESNAQILELIEKAKAIDSFYHNINIDKTEILVYLRLKQYDKAQTLLCAYQERIAAMGEEFKHVIFFEQEYNWATNMILKIKTMSI